MTSLMIPSADLGEMIVSIVAVVVSVITAGIAFWAIRQSGKANDLAHEANQLARDASRQSEEFFAGEAPNAAIALRQDDDGLLLATVKSTGRLDVVVEDVLLECVGTGARISARREFIKRDDYPVTLQPSATYLQEFSPYLLASAADLYGGRHAWRAAPVIGGEVGVWSDGYEAWHPDEATLEEQLEAYFRTELHPFESRVRVGIPSAERGAAIEELGQLGVRLNQLQALYEASRPVPSSITTMIVNAERRYGEAKEGFRG